MPVCMHVCDIISLFIEQNVLVKLHSFTELLLVCSLNCGKVCGKKRM